LGQGEAFSGLISWNEHILKLSQPIFHVPSANATVKQFDKRHPAGQPASQPYFGGKISLPAFWGVMKAFSP